MSELHYEFIEVEIPDCDPEFFDLWIPKIIDHYGCSEYELCYIFCSDEYLLDINKKHLEHDYYTDVITFDYSDGSNLVGDIFISIDRVKDNANKFGDGVVFNELCRVMAHGLLHLIGYRDNNKNNRDIMRMKENEALALR